MNGAKSASTTSAPAMQRRGLLTGATVALLAGTAIATAAPAARGASSGAAGDDAELIVLGARQETTLALIRAIVLEGKDLPPGITPQSEDQEHRLAEADSEWWRTVNRIAAIGAHTDAGLRVKAQVMVNVLAYVVVTCEDHTLDDIATGDVGDIEDRISLSLARDVLAWRAAA